ncbi:MAG: hypothetical protein K6G87_17520 [Butyrivibrio sp.]|uniref:hypothetical protein n=1 Tax=Butyrivibrio sp. TaxID=28121 RepID=UPI0025EB2E00|nr:hypothetical protein [Butyrivibrio sp.]MCR5773027.1 hypothetical protein [Butyrivibrio sp.]
MLKNIRHFINENNFRIRNILFDILLTIEILVVIIDKSDFHIGFESYIFRFTFLISCLCVFLAIRKYSISDLILIITYSVISVAVYKLSGRNELLRFTVFIAACKDLDMLKKLKLFFYESVAGSTILILLSITGIYGRLWTSAWDDAGSIRYVFGFGDANAFHCMFMMLVLLGLYLYHEKLRWYGYILLALSDILLWMVTRSEAAAAITMLSIIGIAIFRFTNLKKHVVMYLPGFIVYGFCIWFSRYSAINSMCMPNDFIKKVDSFLSGRIINLYWDSVNHYGSIETWHLFSGRDTMDIYFDMGWVRLFFWYGIIPAVFVLAAIVLLYIMCIVKKDAVMMVILVCLALYTLVEAHLVSVYIGRNYILLFMGYYLLQNKKTKIGTKA